MTRRSRPRIASRLALTAIASLLTGLGCAEPEPPRNVLVIVVDTLRWDHVGAYGAARATTPAIDALAAESVRFERAYSTAPWTIPSVASMFTGLYPHAHGAIHFRSKLPPSLDTLAEILSAQGYATAASVSHTVLNLLRRFGQGFDQYLYSEAQGHEHLSTPGVSDQAVAFLKEFARQDEPFFLFLHYFDPHYAYRHHPRVGFADPPVERLSGDESINRLREMLPELTQAELDFIVALYDEEIRFTDAGIGRVLETLKELGLEEETLVVFTADHGEEFGERGWLGHTRTLREEVVRVPLIIRDPRAAPKAISQPVSLVSLAPTVLDLLGIEVGARPFHGRSLAPLLLGGEPQAFEPILIHVDFDESKDKRTHKLAIVDERYKLILDVEDQRAQLFDLLEDPLEERDLSDSEPRLRKELLARAEVLERRAGPRGTEREEGRISEQELEALRALGYVSD